MVEPEIILASGSPRRRELLGGMGIAFEVVTADVREFTGGDSPGLALNNAHIKVLAVKKQMPGRSILGADTIVVLDKNILGKPASLNQARDYLRLLSGRTHEVITGCMLFCPNSARKWESFFGRSRVTFRALSEETIARYLGAVNVLDKAGGYAIQEHGDWIIDRVEGSRSNIVGLPTEVLRKVLLRHRLLPS